MTNTHHTTRTDRINAATSLQQAAANPTTSVWLAANAGTGKTTVLVQRIIRLLMHDVTLQPSKILALTFSHAAAREMSERLHREVTKHTQEDAKMRGQWLTRILARTATEADDVTFMALPARLQLHPVSTLTLHGFCQRILQRFPLEAGLQPNFTLWDEPAQKDALKQARSSAIRTISTPEHPQHWAFIWLVGQQGELALNDGVNVYIQNRDKIKNALTHDYDERLRTTLNIAPNAKVADLIEELNTQLPANTDVINYVQNHLDTLQQGGKKAQQWAADFNTMLNLKNGAQSTAWQSLFLNSNGTPASWHNFITKAIQPDIPADFEAVLTAEQTHLTAHQNHLKAIRTYLNTSAFVMVGKHTEELYAQRKKTANTLDFNDLITHAATLLNTPEISDWVRYRLDGGVQHILLDETQDTNLMQWHVIQALTADFYTGADQHDSQNNNPRTLFAVGDFKQSIYRFQGAESAVFSAIKQPLLAAQKIGYTTLPDGMLTTSFRSVPTILEAVDDVFNTPEYAEKIAPAGQKVNHISTRVTEPGRVDIWPPVHLDKQPPPAPWTPAAERQNTTNANTILCQNIATEIQRLLNSDQPVDLLTDKTDTTNPTGRNVTLPDIMLIMRARTVLGHLTAALSAAGIPFTTIQKPEEALEHPVVADVLNLLKFIAHPHDDVALLGVLRSPLFAWSNAQILTLLQARSSDVSAWDALPESSAKISLTDLLEATKHQNPYVVLCHANAQFKLAQTLAVNIGSGATAWQETEAHITAFFTAAQNFMAQNNNHTLALFVDHLENTGLAVTAPNNTGAVRILTAHGAKGLESPIVFIVDGGRNMFGQKSKEKLAWQDDTLFMLRQTDKKTAASQQIVLDDAERHRTLQDELRLLYVAMTRAEERLYICGAGNSIDNLLKTDAVTNTPNNWWGIAANTAIAKNWAGDAANGWSKTDPNAQQLSLPQHTKTSNTSILPTQMPAWVTAHYALNQAAKPQQSAAQLRGEAIHRALELWPLPLTTLQNMFPHDTAAAQSVLDTVAKHPWLFSAHAQAEVPLIFKGRKYIIDRLIIENNTVTIADFKTGTSTTSTDHLPQLQTYAQAAQILYPNHTIKIGILWLDTQKWEDLSPQIIS